MRTSQYANTGALVISFLIASNAACCELSQVKGVSFLQSALSGAIDLYHAAAILSPRGTKSFVFARPASHWMRGWTGKIFCFSIA